MAECGGLQGYTTVLVGSEGALSTEELAATCWDCRCKDVTGENSTPQQIT